MQVGIAEFLEKVSKLRTKQEKIEALKANDTVVLRSILQGAFDPEVKWLLPEGEPPYKPNNLVDQEHILINDIRKLHYFVEGFYDGLKQNKREMMFVELLERVAPEDAKLLISIKDKKLHVKGIDIHMVAEALPGIIPSYDPNKEYEEKSVSNGKPFPPENPIICPHCGREGRTESMMKLYHFDNCKHKKEETLTVKEDQVNTNEQITA